MHQPATKSQIIIFSRVSLSLRILIPILISLPLLPPSLYSLYSLSGKASGKRIDEGKKQNPEKPRPNM